MAYAQWVSISIQSVGSTIQVKNAKLAWGKFYEGNKDNEISTDQVNKLVITSGNSVQIASCGREDSASGTEGSFDLYHDDIKIGTYYWECPWGSKTNISTWTPNDVAEYITQVSGGNLDSGALGNITIKCASMVMAQ